MTTRHLAWLGVLTALALTPALAAPGGQQPTDRKLDSAKSQKAAEWTESDYKAVRDRDEARQRLWDKKMKALTGSICTGC